MTKNSQGSLNHTAHTQWSKFYESYTIIRSKIRKCDCFCTIFEPKYPGLISLKLRLRPVLDLVYFRLGSTRICSSFTKKSRYTILYRMIINFSENETLDRSADDFQFRRLSNSSIKIKMQNSFDLCPTF